MSAARRRPGVGAERGAVRKAAAGSTALVARAARAALSRGNAVDAVVAAVLVAAAESPGVLLGPIQLIAGGGGAGLLAIDGRVRQPGLGAPRPRGFLVGEAVPETARVGVPTMPATLAAALGSLGTSTLQRAVAPAVAAARLRSPERARLMGAMARHGAAALAESAIAEELTAAAGRAARGLLTQRDLSDVRPAVVHCEEQALEPPGVLTVPWRDGEPADGSNTHVVAAGDGGGLVAIACFEASAQGVPVPALGVLAPHSAAPVMRGRARVRPGEPRPAAAPVALRVRGGRVELALGIALAHDADRMLDDGLIALGRRSAVADLLAIAEPGRPVALVLTRECVVVAASA